MEDCWKHLSWEEVKANGVGGNYGQNLLIGTEIVSMMLQALLMS